MQKVAPKGLVLKGIDVSHYDGKIDFKMVKLSGRDFVISKCTEYTADDTYAKNKSMAREAGIIFGAYHFFHPSKDPSAQAYNFLNRAQLAKGDLIPCLDWESTDNVPSAHDRANGKLWLDIVEKSLGRPPIIYGSPYFLQALGLDSSFAKYPLWVAHYQTSAPLVPAPWTNWAFWQITDKGDVPGIPSPDEDLDVFNGSHQDLEKLLL